MTVDPDSQYLADIDAEGKALDDEATRLEAKYKADRDDIAARRAGNEQARRHFLAYLAKKGTSLPGLAPQALVGANTNRNIPLPMRMGDLRRLMLDTLLKSSPGLTVREIAQGTGIASKVVYTYAQREIAAGILTRVGDRLLMTNAGRDYMYRAEIKFGPSKKPKAPPVQAGGVFQ